MEARIRPRLALANLSYDALLEIATHGCERDAETLTLADLRISEECPLPGWCVEKVLMAQDLLPKLLAIVPTKSGLGVCLLYTSPSPRDS